MTCLSHTEPLNLVSCAAYWNHCTVKMNILPVRSLYCCKIRGFMAVVLKIACLQDVYTVLSGSVLTFLRVLLLPSLG
jgi:hypothetical protein